MSPADTSLWRSWRERRDAGAFEALVTPHLPFASAFAHRLGCRGADADDVVQRALVSLVTDARGKAESVGVRAWLGRSVLNEVRMASRSTRRRAGHERLAVKEQGPAGDPLEVRDEVEVALARLGPDDRHLVELRFLHDMEYREVAFMTGRSALACRLRVHRALGKLRRDLGRAAPLLVASIALPALAPSAHAAVPRAWAAAPAAEGTAAMGLVEGGLVMGTSGKVAVAVGVVLLLGGGGWWAMARREPEGGGAAQSVPLASKTAEPAAAPAALAAGGRASGSAPAVASVPVGGAATPDPGGVPLDAPISPGKGSVAGTLRLEDGTPLAGARVALTIVPTEKGADVATTDAEGRFHLHDQWVGERPLVLVEPDGTVLILRNVAMRADARVTVEATVARGVALAGVVRDATTREPLAGAWVTLRRRGSHSANALQAGYGGATTDASGQFRFRYVPAARYTVESVFPSREPQLSVVEVGPRDVELEVALAAARALIVRYEPAPKEAVGERMAWDISGPITSAEQLSYGTRGDDLRVLVSENGELRLDAPPPGRYHLILFGTKVLPRLDTEFEVTAAEVPVIRVPVAPGGRVVGTLRDADGRPVAGRKLGIARVSSEATDADGRFAFSRVKAGEQAVSVLMSGCWVSLGTVEIDAGGETILPLRLPGTATLALTVDSPPTGAYLTLTTLDGTKVAEGSVSDREEVSLVGLAAGTYRLRMGAVERSYLEREVRLDVGATLHLGAIGPAAMPVVPVRVAMPPGVARPAMITVLELTRLPDAPQGASQEVLFGAGRIEFDGEGRGWLKGLPAGRHHVFLQAAPSMNRVDLTEVDLDVREGITTPIEITIRPW